MFKPIVKKTKKYWGWFKTKIKKEEDFQFSRITRQLKLKVLNGKYYNTGVVKLMVSITNLN